MGIIPRPHDVATPVQGGSASRQAFLLLRTVFTVAPIVFGLDKFANVLADWPHYLAPWINDLIPGTAQQAMYAVGVVEVLAGVAVALLPRFGGLLVAAWLAGIIVNLLSIPDYYDVALRDFGLLVSALALSRLAAEHSPRTLRSRAER
ncbi:DoxX family membrane protein [Terrabacter sp. MAHUQ-38]|nr:DoxX family membrane protein [Terrabacter sp. MAHUQ-38]MBC9822888.1 DoxX family membrane protein [Terrabacter sp. MAHUQ-38]